MFDVLLQPFKTVKLYHINKCYGITHGDIEIMKTKGNSPKIDIAIKGVLDSICAGLAPVKAGKHSYVVQPVSYNNGILDIDDRTIKCDVVHISIADKELYIDDKGTETVKDNKMITLHLRLPLGVNFSDKFIAKEPEETPIETSRYALMDLDD